MPLPEQLVILVVEDREDDVLLIKRAFQQAGIKNPVCFLRDGEDAKAYLEGKGKYCQRDEYPLPDLILLDLKMPKVDGFELLEWIRAQPTLRGLRIVVLTSSEEIYDVNKAYEMGANSFLVKPFEFENYAAMMRTLNAFWMKHSLPPQLQRPPPKKGNGSEGNGQKEGNKH